MKKRTVKRNRWGNWRGYVGGRFVREFAADHPDNMPSRAREWLAAPWVVVEVRGGCAEVLASSPGVEVEIIDFDDH